MDNGAADYDLHDAAREVLRHIKFQKTTPVYLQEHQGGYGDLCGWLEEFPNTVVSFDYWYLAHLESVVDDNTLVATLLYAKAVGLLQFCKRVPLEHIVIQSGAYSPRDDATPRKPNEFLLAANLLQRLTGTPAAVYIEQTAINAARVYRLNDELMDNIRRSPDTSQHQRCTRENLRRNIDAHILSLNLVAAAPAPRADHDQEGSGRRSSLALPADNAGGQPGAGVQGLVVPSIAPRSHSASRSPRHRSPRDADGSGGRRARSPTKRDKKPSPKATDKTNARKPKSIKSRSSSEEDSGTKTKAAKTKQRPEDPDRAKKGPKTPPEKRSRSRSRSSRRRSRSRSRSPTRPSSSGRSHHLSYRTESASRRSDSDRRRDSYRSGSGPREDRHHDDQRKRRDGSRESERQRLERLRDEDRRKRRDQRRDKSPLRDVPSTSRDAYKRHDKDEKQRSSRSSTKTPPPAVQSQVFVVPNPPKARAPIRAPSQETQESRASSRTSTSSQRTYTNRLRDRVMIPKAVATADNAGAPYKVIQRKQRPSADNAETEAPLRRNTGEGLLKSQPLPPLGIIRPTADEIEQHVEGFFSPDIDADSQLRGFYTRDFASNPVDPPQPDTFSVPPDGPWTPSQKCSCGEDVPPGFHLTIEKANYIPIRRWRAHPAFKGPGRDEKLNAVANMKIYSLEHMILVNWVACLKSNKDDRAVHIIEFLYRVLQTYDEDEILALLLEFQPLMVIEATEEDKGSRSMWPAHKDFKPAVERWTSCCPHAFRYIFDRLSGPITWAPQWLQSDGVPEDCQRSVRNGMIAEAETVFNELRHVLYRQYGLRHIQAVLNFQEFCWKRFDNDPKRETHRNGVCVNVHTIVFAEDRVIAAFGTNLKDSVRMIPVPDGNRKEIRDAVLKYFPGPQVRRVVFWFGQSSIAEHDYDDYDRVILDLSHIYATYLGYLEQVVVLPPYVRINSTTWACLALHLHMEREDLLRFARVALYPVDLQYYERDQRLGTDAEWPSTFGITEDGRYRTRTIAGRKRFLEDHHDLDLWKPSTKPTKKATTSAVPPAIDYSDVDREENADRAASPTRPITSANTAATTKASAGPPAPPTMRDGRTTQPTASTIVPTNFGASTSAAVPNLEPINTAFSAFLQRQTEDFQALQRALFEQLANQQAAASTSQPADPKSRHKDQKSGHRK
ncbi:hypothetical protein AAVH_14251 [Aphelenchoides avenae]|nr:hypothetical protein AAVH_14251 [Aphelenchus avenae]